MRFEHLGTLSLLLLLLPGGSAIAEPGAEEQVSVEISGEYRQPAGSPALVELKLTNTGESKISWWCGGPDTYPQAGLFGVEVLYLGQREYKRSPPSNGQYVEGSGVFKRLAPGDSMTVPLAVPINLADFGDLPETQRGLKLRVIPKEWKAEKPAEFDLKLSSEHEVADHRRTMLVEAVVKKGSHFLKHVATKYPDPDVLEAMLKLITVDSVQIAGNAAAVLARQPELPEEAGESLARMVQRWAPRKQRPGWGGLRTNMITAALRTKEESVRALVLHMLDAEKNPRERGLLINAIRVSPGGEHWLRRAHSALVGLQKKSPDDANLAKQIEMGTRWLDARLSGN